MECFTVWEHLAEPLFQTCDLMHLWFWGHLWSAWLSPALISGSEASLGEPSQVISKMSHFDAASVWHALLCFCHSESTLLSLYLQFFLPFMPHPQKLLLGSHLPLPGWLYASAMRGIFSVSLFLILTFEVVISAFVITGNNWAYFTRLSKESYLRAPYHSFSYTVGYLDHESRNALNIFQDDMTW